MKKADEERQVGLKAVTDARTQRGRSKTGRVSGSVWLAAGGAVVLVVGLSWLFSDRTVGKGREALLAQQHAAQETVGKEWTPLRDRIEGLTLEAAKDFKGDHVDPAAAKWDFRSVPGIYLRLRVADAKDVKSLREKAKDSLRDSFTGCLLKQTNMERVKDGADAGYGPDQPWNLRQAYASTRVLTEEWQNEVKASEERLRLHVFEEQYEKAKTTEIPLAIDIIKRAQFYLLVLDEDTDEAKQFSDGGIDEEGLQQVPHDARIHIWNLKTGAEMVRLRRVGEGTVGMTTRTDMNGGMLGPATLTPEVSAALRRQVNNCTLAQEVWSAIRPPAPNAEK